MTLCSSSTIGISLYVAQTGEHLLDNLCAFRMYYDGNYIECISGYLHEGYIVAHQGAGRLHTQVIEEASKYLNYDNLQFDLYD